MHAPLIVWLRQDLRLHDNSAIQAAHAAKKPIIFIYCLENKSLYGDASCWWLHHSLLALQNDIHKLGCQLIFRSGEALQQINQLINETKADTIFWNRCYEPAAILRDKNIKAKLQASGHTVKTFNSSLLQEPWEILNKQNAYFKVFTPYWKHCLSTMPTFTTMLSVPNKLLAYTQKLPTESLTEWNLLPKQPNWAANFSNYWQPGEQGAHDRLNQFLANDLTHYASERDFPAKQVTSHLSPHLHFGEIGPRQIWHAIQNFSHEHQGQQTNVQKFLSELGWREFSYYLLYHFPELPEKNFQSKFDQFSWDVNQKFLRAWQQGKTGYPLVDAGMRELWQTGYMHNRVRMIVASFLVKHLLIDWRKGADWFLDTLVDADLANNSAGWQWVAGSGADAAPYFRVFNPVLQSKKFDPQGEYIKRWIPELKNLSAKEIHEPWKLKNNPYLSPIIDLDVRRQQALERYKKLK